MSFSRTVQVFSPDARFSRHSEGDFLRLRDGRILFVYCRFEGEWYDDQPCNLVGCYSSNEGESWTEPRLLIPAATFGVKNIMSVSLMRMENGDLGLFYLVKVTPIHSRIMLSRSRDEGETFYCHTECTDPEIPFYYVVNNSRVERLNSGRLLIPAAYHRGSVGPSGRYYVDGRSLVVFFLSDDDGRTWRQARDMLYPPFTDTTAGLQEPGVIERDGGLYAWFRTDKYTQYESFSVDGGESWSVPQPSRFSGPLSPLEIARDPRTHKLYAVWNPIANYPGRVNPPAAWGRNPLVMAISDDNGLTWSDPEILADEPDRGYCYPALFFTGDQCALIAYCSGGSEEKSCLAQLTIQKRRLN